MNTILFNIFLSDEDKDTAMAEIGEAVAYRLRKIYDKSKSDGLDFKDEIEYKVYTIVWYILNKSGYEIPGFTPEVVKLSSVPDDYTVFEYCINACDYYKRRRRLSYGVLTRRDVQRFMVYEMYLTFLDWKEILADDFIKRFKKEHRGGKS